MNFKATVYRPHSQSFSFSGDSRVAYLASSLLSRFINSTKRALSNHFKDMIFIHGALLARIAKLTSVRYHVGVRKSVVMAESPCKYAWVITACPMNCSFTSVVVTIKCKTFLFKLSHTGLQATYKSLVSVRLCHCI